MPFGASLAVLLSLRKYKLMMKLLALIALSISSSAFATDARSYNTTKAMVEINDPKADRNPVRSVAVPKWKAVAVKAKLKPKNGQDIAIACEGKFPVGVIADGLYRQNGNFNRSFVINNQTTVMDLCNQMEDNMRRENPRLFK